MNDRNIYENEGVDLSKQPHANIRKPEIKETGDPRQFSDPRLITLGEGTVKLSCSKKRIIITLVITGVLLAPVFRWLVVLLASLGKTYSAGGADASDKFVFEIFLIALCAVFFVVAFILNIVLSGENYNWSATGREFMISKPGRPTSVIFYEKVRDISFEPYKMLGFYKLGWKVFIRTFDGDYEFKYVFPFGKRISEQDTPFWHIERIVETLRNGRTVEEMLHDRRKSGYDIGMSREDALEDAFRSIVRNQYDREFSEKERSRERNR